ncbi:MAG: AsmA family protein [Alphaproteobacteria bacterium]|nr:AsmA family protein [Alphaproteobacteria bacterium]
MKKILFGAATVIALVIAAAVLLPALLDLNDYKDEIAEQVEAATGRKLTIDGSITARLLPSPGATVTGLRFANLSGGSRPDLATLKSIDVNVAFVPLLSGRVQVTSVTLVEPAITIETLADGRSNLEFAPASSAAKTGSSPERRSGDLGSAIRVDRLRVTGGSIVYGDVRTKDYLRLDKIDLRVTTESLNGPFAAAGSLDFRGVPVDFAVTAGSITEKSVPVSAEITLDRGAAKIVVKGSASEIGPSAKIGAKLDVSSDSLGRFASVIAQIAGTQAPVLPALPGSVKIGATIVGASTDIAFNDINLQLGESKATGAVSVTLSAAPKFDVALSLNRVNLDDLIKASTAAPAAVKPGAPAAQSAASPVEKPFAIPLSLTGTANVEIEALSFKGGVIRQVRLEAGVAKGQVKLTRLAAQLPGGSDIALSGTLAAVKDEPQFDGRVEATSDNMRQLMQWLASDLTDVPADQLRKFSLTARTRVNPQVMQLYDIDLHLDTARVTGGAAYALRARPSFSVDLALDRLNIDAYLPRSKSDSAKGSVSASAAKPAPAARRDDALPFAILDTFDTNVKLKADSLMFRETAAQGLKLDMSLVGGQLTVRELSAVNIAGTALALAGTGANFRGVPSFAVNYNINAGDIAKLAKLADASVPAALTKLGVIAVKGSISGSEQNMTLDTGLKAAGIDGKITGRVAGFATPDKSTVDLSLDFKVDDIGELARRLDPAADAGIKGAGQVRGKVVGGLNAADVDLVAQLSGGQVSAKGTVAPLAGPDFKLALNINHPKLTDLVAMTGVAYQPAAANLGGIAIKANLAGGSEKIVIDGIDGSIGPVKVAGNFTAALGGGRPNVSADLRTSEILLDLFLPKTAAMSRPPAAAGRQQGVVPAGQRWSTEPIDVSALRDFDADIQLASSGIVWGAYNFADPKVKIAVKNGILEVAPLTGKLFGGEVQLTAKIDATQVPRVAVGLNVARGNLAQAVREAAGIDSATGIFDIQMQLAGAGRSQFDLISNLSGQGQISARQGTVRGFDLRMLSEGLKRLNEITDYLGLLQTAFGGGTTGFQSIAGTFQVQNGVVRSTDIRAQLNAAEGDAQAGIDLPRWMIDIKSRYRLTEHANAPTVGYDVSGPLDSPKSDVKTKELEAFLAQRLGASVLKKAIGKNNPLGAVLEGLTGGGQQPAQQPPSSQQQTAPNQQQQKTPAQQLLEGLLGGKKKN